MVSLPPKGGDALKRKSIEEIPDILFLRPEDKVLQRLQICLAFKMGVKKKDIADRYNVVPKTIFNLSRSFEEEGIKGLMDKPRAGKPQALDENDKKLALTLKVKDPSLGCRAIAEEIESEKGKKLSHKTIERFLKFCGLLTFHGTGVKKTPHTRKRRKARKNLYSP